MDPPDDLYHQLLRAVSGPADEVLDRLSRDKRLRDSVRHDLVPGLGDRAYRAALPPGPDAFQRRVAAEIPGPQEQGRGRHALDLIGAALLHPDEPMRVRAREVAGQPFPAPPHQAEIAAGAGPAEVTPALAPADRLLVESGVRDCYHLAGLPDPPPIVWAASPYTGMLLRRLAAPLYAPVAADGPIPAPRPVLWSRGDGEPDDLRARIEFELRGLLPPVRTVEPVYVVTDPAQARRALEEAAHRLPRPRPRLGPGDPPADGPHVPLPGQSIAGWVAAATRIARALDDRTRGDLLERLAAYDDANAAGPWWPGSRVVIVCERPAARDGSTERWADGTELSGN